MPKLLILLLVIHVALLSILPFTTWPEMLLYPWLVHRGYALYTDIINPYFPGLIWLLTLIEGNFGFTSIVLKFFTLGIIVTIDVLLFVVARKIYRDRAALLTLTLFIMWQVLFEGNSLWFDIALTPAILLAFYLLVLWKEGRRNIWIILASAVLTLSCLIKQTGMWFVLASVSFVGIRSLLFLLLPFTAFITIFIAALSHTNPNFWYWAILFPLIDQKQVSGFILLPSVREIVLSLLVLLPMLVGLSTMRKLRAETFSFAMAGIFSVMPRWGLFHFQPALPFLALIAGSFFQVRPLKASLALFVIPIYFTITSLVKDVGKEDRFVTDKVLQTVRELHEYKGTIFVYGAPQIVYVLSAMLPPRPWADLFPWYYEARGGELKSRVFSNLIANPPKYVLYAPPSGDREEYRYRPSEIESWILNSYIPIKVLSSGSLLQYREGNQ